MQTSLNKTRETSNYNSRINIFHSSQESLPTNILYVYEKAFYYSWKSCSRDLVNNFEVCKKAAVKTINAEMKF